MDEGDGREEPNAPPPEHLAQHLAPQPPLPVRVRRPARRAAAVAAGLTLAGGAAWAALSDIRPASVPTRPPVVTSTHADRAPATARTPDPQTALAELLRQRASAVLTENRSRWMATVDPRATSFRRRQADLFGRLKTLPITRWAYQLPAAGSGGSGSAAGSDRRVVEVRLAYRLAPDGRDTQRRQSLTVQRRAGRWYIRADDDGQTDRDLWDLGPITIERGRRTLVVGQTSQSGNLDRFAADTDEAIDRVSSVWGRGWARKVVVIVPRDVRQMATVLGRRKAAGLDKLAAVTTGVVEHNGDGRSADRIVINPKAFASFSALGRRVVLTHEVTHVATRPAGTVSSPLWLDEGFADYVGFRASGLARAAVARTLLTAVRRGRGPSRLPGVDDFDPTKGEVDSAYEGSWLAMELIGRDGGPARVVRFYRTAIGTDEQPGPASAAAGRGQASLEEAFRGVLSTDQRRFERHWRGYLADLARQAA